MTIKANEWTVLLAALGVVGSVTLTVQVNAVECNPDNCPPDGCEVTGNDCQPNGADDDIDIVEGTSQDCNGNRIPDECELTEYRPIDVVFLLDTSDSMDQSPLVFARLCDAVNGAIAQLDTAGICVRSEKLALVPGQDVPCTESFCCEGDAFSQYGTVACEYFDVEAQNCGGCGAGSWPA